MNPLHVPTSYRIFQATYLALALNFLIPSASYLIDPSIAIGQLTTLEAALGGRPLPVETGHVWHMLAVGNVATLGVMCAMILSDLRRFHAAVPALVFLKGFSATYSLGIAAYQGLPVFYAIFALDGLSALAMAVTAERAIDDLDGRPHLPAWSYVLLPRPRVIRANLQRLVEWGTITEVPTLWQVFLGTMKMRHRLLFRSYTIGTSAHPVRPGLRARLLAWRALRAPVLLAEGAVAPFDLSGLALSEDRLIRHLVGAHHDGPQFAYDLELLGAYDGGLVRLQGIVAEIVASGGRRAAFLRDLTVFEGYHERLLAAVRAAIAGGALVTPDQRDNPDLTATAWLRWCAKQPASPTASARAWLVRGNDDLHRPVTQH